MFVVDGIGDGNGVDGGFGFHGPEFFSGVSRVSGKFSGSLPLKYEIAGGGEDAAVDGDFFFDGPARLLLDGIPGDEAADESFAAFSVFDFGLRACCAIGRGDINEAGGFVVAHGPPVVDGPLFAAALIGRNFDGASGSEIVGMGPGGLDKRIGGN